MPSQSVKDVFADQFLWIKELQKLMNILPLDVAVVKNSELIILCFDI